MSRKGKANRENFDGASTTPQAALSKLTGRASEHPVPSTTRADSVQAPSDFDVDAPLDPLAAVLADGSDVPSRRVLAPSREDIERRAYEIYLRRAGAPGQPEEDWYQAERELAEELRVAQERSPGGGRRAAARTSRKTMTPAMGAGALRRDKAEA